MVLSKSLILVHSLPSGRPVPGTDLLITTSEIDITSPPPPGSLLLKANYLSYDPFQRGRMRDHPDDHPDDAIPTFVPGQPITNIGLCTVLLSSNPLFSPGDIVMGWDVPFSEYFLEGKEKVETQWPYGYRKLEGIPKDADPVWWLGVLGLSGLTAYSSFYELAKPKKGEVLYVSSASGAVGQIVGQLGKREGMKVIGSVGGERKVKYIREELGFDNGFDWRGEGYAGLKRCLDELGEGGVDVYFDNVGGEGLDEALVNMNVYGRILACGSISQYNNKPGEGYRLQNWRQIENRRLRMSGLLTSDPDLGFKYMDEHQENMLKWVLDGSIKVKMEVTEGMDRAAEGLVDMLEGRNFGKAVLKVRGFDE